MRFNQKTYHTLDSASPSVINKFNDISYGIESQVARCFDGVLVTSGKLLTAGLVTPTISEITNNIFYFCPLPVDMKPQDFCC